MEGLIPNLIKIWFNDGFFGKVYIIFTIVMLIVMTLSIKTFFTKDGKKKLKFILEAQEKGCCIPGKLTCFTKEGKFDDFHYVAEYMYVVNDKRYFVTYQINPYQGHVTSDKDELNGDILAYNIQKYPMLFYNEKNPAEVYCKAEVFTSFEAFHQTVTAKNNMYRNVEKDWVEAISLLR